MKINICPELWERYLGKWNFSFFLDYTLEIKRNKKSISIDMFDILRDEKCELIPIRSCDEYLSFWMRSSWTNIKFSIFQHLNNENLIIEFTDGDIYKKTSSVRVNQSHKYIIDFDAAEIPDWIYGTWKTTDNLEYIHIGRKGNHISIALWTDLGDIPPTKNRSFRKVIAVYDIDHFNIKIILKGCDHNNKTRDIVILFDSDAKEIRLIHSRMVEAERL